MADDPNPLNETVDTAFEAVTFSTTPKRTVALKTARAYLKSILVSAVKVFPLLTIFMSGQTSIQQETLRRPDEYQASSSKSTEVPLAGENRLRISTATSSIEFTVRVDEFDPWINTVSHVYYMKTRQVAAILAAEQERVKHQRSMFCPALRYRFFNTVSIAA